MDLAEARRALRDHFGFEDFREGQAEVIQSVLEGQDTVVVMPTGGGKSLCYQLPAMVFNGVTVVVSPLIALMKDQVDALRDRRLPATFINSSLSFEEQKERIRGVRRSEYKLIYVAPERFKSNAFTESLKQLDISLFAVDEAHCISHWGHDFRPDYLRLNNVLNELGRPQVIALTATATPYVRADIIEQLGLSSPRAYVSGFDRPNLSLNVIHVEKELEKIGQIRSIARANTGSGIVYTSTRKSVEQVTAKLRTAGLDVVAYHAGMSDTERERAQESFMKGSRQIIVATNAFGMGIDKSDIRFVVHYHLPGSIEAYYQEIGRAGRDGQLSYCTLLFNYADKRTQDYFIEGSYPQPMTIANVYEALISMGQRRLSLTTSELSKLSGVKNEMAISSTLVILEKAGHINRTMAVETNSRSRVIELMDEGPLTRLRVNPQEIARRAALEQRKLREMINFCYTDRCYRSFVLDYFGDKHHKPNCGSCGNCTLANRRSVNLQPDHTSTDLDRFVIQNAPLGTDLEIELASNSRKKSVAERAEQHLETSSGRTLDEQEMLIVRKILSCVARMKGKFGKSMVAATLRGSNSLKIKSSSLDQLSTFGILNHLTQDQIIAYIDSLVVTRCLELSRGEFPTIRLTDLGGEVMKGLCSISLPLSPQIVKKIKAKTVSTVDETYKLYQQGLGIEEISEKRGLTVQTVEGHLADCIREGRPFDLQTYVNSDQRSQIVDAVNRLGTERLKPIREALSAEISYRMIRFVVAEMSRPKDDPETEEKGNPPQPPLPPDQKGPSSPVREPEEPPPVKEPPPKEPSRIMFSSGK